LVVVFKVNNKRDDFMTTSFNMIIFFGLQLRRAKPLSKSAWCPVERIVQRLLKMVRQAPLVEFLF